MDIQGNVKFGQGYWIDRFKPAPATTTVVSGGGGSDQRNSFIGTIDGINKIFTLATAPDINNLKVYFNGALQLPPDDYTLNGNQVTFARAPQPASGDFSADVIVAYYGSGSSRQTVSGTIDGINNIFTLPSAPNALSLQFFWNGSLQFEGIDYTLNGNQVTLSKAPKATDGIPDILVAYF